MRPHFLSRGWAASRAALSYVASQPPLAAFYVILSVWTVMGLGTLFNGMLGLLVEGLLFLLLGPAALVVCFAVGRNPTRMAKVHAFSAFILGGALVTACPNSAGPHVFFAVRGQALDGLARELAAARCDLWIEAPRPFGGSEPPFNVAPPAVEPLRARLHSLGVLSVGVKDGEIVFPVDGFADNVRGFVYFGEGARRPKSGEGFHFGMLGQLVPMSRPGWYFFHHNLRSRDVRLTLPRLL